MKTNTRTVLFIAARAVRSFLRHQGPNHAAAAAFYSLLSVIPMFFLTVLIIGELIGDRGQALSVAGSQLSGLVPWFDEELMHRIRRLTWAAPRLGPLSMAVICWTAGLFFAMLRRNLRLPWMRPDAAAGSSPAWRESLRFWLVTPFVSALLLAALAMAMYLGAWPGLALSRAELRHWGWLLPAWNFVWPWAFVFAAYLVLLPGIRPLRLTLAVSGVLALAGWGLTALFTAVLAHLPRHALIYGPMGDLVLFLLWLNYNSALLVYGGHFIRLWRREHPLRERTGRLWPPRVPRPGRHSS